MQSNAVIRKALQGVVRKLHGIQGSGKRKRLEQAQSLELLHGSGYEGLGFAEQSEQHSLVSPGSTLPLTRSLAAEEASLEG